MVLDVRLYFGLCREQHDVKRINISMLTVENVSYVLWKDAKAD